VSAKLSGTSKRTGTTGIEFDSRENLHEEGSYNLQNFSSHKIVVEREYTVKTGSAVWERTMDDEKYAWWRSVSDTWRQLHRTSAGDDFHYCILIQKLL
jgi:hypothetical protein